MPERGRWLPWLALSLLLVLGGGAALIGAGLFDPPHNSLVAATQPLTRQTIPAGGVALTWLPDPLPSTNYSVRLTAVHQSGEPDVGLGLRLGDGAKGLTVLVSPLGYVTVRVGETAVLPWQPWPHVGRGGAANEIWLNVGGVAGDGRVAVWLNRELLWTGMVGDLPGPLGLLGESYGETAVGGWETGARRETRNNDSTEKTTDDADLLWQFSTSYALGVP